MKAEPQQQSSKSKFGKKIANVFIFAKPLAPNTNDKEKLNKC